MLFLLGLVLLHFLPTIVASSRDCRSTVGIFLLNLLLGWTVVGWVAALVWALLGARRVCYFVPAQGAYRRY